MNFARNICLIPRQIPSELDDLSTDNPANRANDGECYYYAQEHRCHSANPLLQPADQSRQQECDKRSERDRDKDGAAEIKRGDNESEKQYCPDTVESDSRVRGESACAHPDALVALAEFNSSR
jgi:hypothetical protein